jgi:hypothetical protein
LKNHQLSTAVEKAKIQEVLKQLFEIDRDMRKLLNQPSDNNFF